MNEMQVFRNDQFGEIRTVDRDGETWFVAADICRALEIGNTADAVKRLEDDELISIQSISGGQKREMIAVNEPGLYSLILGSRKPEARAFKRWVTHEVLPSIRRTGAYATRRADDGTLEQQNALLREQVRLLREKMALQDELRQRPPIGALPASAMSVAREGGRFVHTLRQMLSDGDAHVQSVYETAHGIDPNAIGFEDEMFLYLTPASAWETVAKKCAADGQPLVLTQRLLYRYLRAAGLAMADSTSGTITRGKRIAGRTLRLLWLVRSEPQSYGWKGRC